MLPDRRKRRARRLVGLGVAPDEEPQFAALRRCTAAADRRIEEADTLGLCVTAKLADPVGGQRAGFNADRAALRPGERAVRPEPDAARGVVVRHHGEDEVGACRGFARRRRDLGALASQRLGFGRRAVPDRDLKTLGQPIGGHAASHDAKAENRNALHEHAP